MQVQAREIESSPGEEMIRVRKSQINFYKNVPLYYKANEEFVLYKNSGITLAAMRISESKIPKELYIKASDKTEGIKEVQEGFNRQLEDEIKNENPRKIKKILTEIVEETLLEPRSGNLEGVSKTVNILVDEYSEHSMVIRNLFNVSSTDYSTAIHSINVMALALGFLFHYSYDKRQIKPIGLSALLHDIGKTKINSEILKAPGRLTDEEFNEIKKHTIFGYQILKDCSFNKEIALTALEHHEKLDGSGYPNGSKSIEFPSKLLGIIDSYEALTCDERLYRKAIKPIDALQIIKGDVVENKFDRNIFERFVITLL
jgi:putative nucleotidyltransferase with HDIG domain